MNFYCIGQTFLAQMQNIPYMRHHIRKKYAVLQLNHLFKPNVPRSSPIPQKESDHDHELSVELPDGTHVQLELSDSSDDDEPVTIHKSCQCTIHLQVTDPQRRFSLSDATDNLGTTNVQTETELV